MNLVGKILTALITVLALVFMTIAMAVYATHMSWYKTVKDPQNGLEARLKSEKDSKTKLQQQYDQLVQDREAEKKDLRGKLDALKTEADVLRKNNADLGTELAKVKESERKDVEVLNVTQKNTTAALAERDQLRKEYADARKQRDESFDKTVLLTDDLNQAANENRTLKGRNVELVQDLKKYKDFFTMQNLKMDIDVARAKITPSVEGRVLKSTEAGLIEISLGADAGLKKGHTLHVFRVGAGGPTYLGKVEVVETEPDRAVCKIIPEFRKGTIQRGDHVSAKLG
jgi:septal ring factor EnvC (AmiA/AmiB activator)